LRLSDSKTTLIPTDVAATGAGRRTSSWTLPPDLEGEAVRRVRALALLYALAYFLAGLLPWLRDAESREIFLSKPIHWLPPVASIIGGLVVAWLVSRPGLPTRAKMFAGLAFGILGSYGIAAGEFHDIVSPVMYRDGPGGLGLSWVAVWVLLGAVVVPSPPRVTLLVSALSLTAVPVMYSLGGNMPVAFEYFFLGLVFPYIVVLLMAYVGSRVVYNLGAAVREARELGSYRLVQRLGQGGMGEVWRAQHRMLARPAAIKLIRPEVLGGGDGGNRPLLLRRFEREAQATALMRSAHTMELYDFGVAEDGTFYYVMELLDGFDLDELIERFGPVPPERAVHFIRQMCSSLAEAHEAGLIHRDVKPANIYACRYGREVDFIKVLDFGLVKHGRSLEGADAKLTAADMSAGGTPAFISPEQALGDKDVDGRSDLYSVGCVAYWLLTGTTPFRGSTPMETIVMHVHQAPEPASVRSGLPIPADLEAVVMSCLAKDPGDRPQTADELAARLASVRLEQEWTLERARAWWDVHRPAGDLPPVA
jgi:eukaryotic-like serine/threonine-protein kinase